MYPNLLLLQMRQYPALYGESRTASRFSASSRKGLDESDVALREEFADDSKLSLSRAERTRGEGGCGISVVVSCVADDTWGQQIAGDDIQDEWSD